MRQRQTECELRSGGSAAATAAKTVAPGGQEEASSFWHDPVEAVEVGSNLIQTQYIVPKELCPKEQQRSATVVVAS